MLLSNVNNEKRLNARGVRPVSVLMGQYELWRGEWPGGPVTRLTERETQALASDDVAWHDPEHATLVVWIREGP